MTLINKKGAGKTDKSSSETPKALKSKRKISKKSQTDGIVDINKLRRDFSFKGKKANKKKNIILGKHSEKRQDSTRIRETHALLQKQQSNETNNEMFGQFKRNEDSQVDQKKHGRNGNKKEKLGGLIFMCNEKTKADCFQYRVMGVPMSKKQIVLGVKPGLKLFLYDFDLRVMYGIYKASCAGGMKLESAAFNGAFPVQVRFNIDQDCYPLSESVFKRAIEENYTGMHRFKMELSVQQVKKLLVLFRRADVQSHAPAIIHPPPMAAIQDREVTEGVRESWPPVHRPPMMAAMRYHVLSNEDDQHLTHTEVRPMGRDVISRDYYPSEKEYRAYGLGTGRQNFSPCKSAPTLEPFSRGYVREQPPLTIPVQDRGINEGRRESQAPHLHSENSALDQYLTCKEVLPIQRENLFQDYYYYPSEKEYRTYGLQSERQNTSPPRSCITPSSMHPSYSLVPRRELQSSTPFVTPTITSTLDSYSKGPFYGSAMESYQQPPSSREEVPLVSYSLSGRGETHPSATDHWQTRDVCLSQSDQSRKEESYLTGRTHLGRIEIKDTQMLHPTYASSALSNYDRVQKYPEDRTVTSQAPLSFVHSLAGPSLFNR